MATVDELIDKWERGEELIFLIHEDLVYLIKMGSIKYIYKDGEQNAFFINASKILEIITLHHDDVISKEEFTLWLL